MRTSNPYSPPAAVVADVALPEMERPKKVTIAMWLIWATVALAMVGFAAGFRRPTDIYQGFDVVVIGLLGFGLSAWLNVMIALRRNWARWVYVSLTALNCVVGALNIGSLLGHFGTLPAPVVAALLRFCIQLVPVALLLTPAAGKWFRSRPGAASAEV